WRRTRWTGCARPCRPASARAMPRPTGRGPVGARSSDGSRHGPMDPRQTRLPPDPADAVSKPGPATASGDPPPATPYVEPSPGVRAGAGPDAQRGPAGGQAGDREAQRRAGDVVQPGLMEEFDRCRVAAVLAAHAEPQQR